MSLNLFIIKLFSCHNIILKVAISTAHVLIADANSMLNTIRRKFKLTNGSKKSKFSEIGAIKTMDSLLCSGNAS